VYDHDRNPLPALEEPHMHALLGPVRGLKVLDLGCGTGRHALWLAEQGAQVTGVDFSAGMLGQAAQKPGADGVQFVVHDLHQPLPFAAGTFDRVASGLVLEHLHDLGHFFGEARRVLKPDGWAVLSAMHPAMFLRGTQARFTDPATGEVIRPASLPHQISDFLMAALAGGFRLEHIAEYAPTIDFAVHYPRAEKYVGWPMLLMLRLWP
jgi:malonyl-CoA O-methyltransferase